MSLCAAIDLSIDGLSRLSMQPSKGLSDLPLELLDDIILWLMADEDDKYRKRKNVCFDAAYLTYIDANGEARVSCSISPYVASTSGWPLLIN